jgi:hypothetical protein
MHFIGSIALLTLAAVASPGRPGQAQPGQPAVPVLQANAVGCRALNQVTSAARSLGQEVSAPVTSLEGGLPYVQRAFKRPILAMAEVEGWFFYATSVARDETTDAPVYFISGYAVQRNGCRVHWWSVW